MTPTTSGDPVGAAAVLEAPLAVVEAPAATLDAADTALDAADTALDAADTALDAAAAALDAVLDPLLSLPQALATSAPIATAAVTRAATIWTRLKSTSPFVRCPSGGFV
jgi:hypothetical protein